VARILLVEDEEEIRSMLAEVLADAGHEVVEAESGDAAALILDQFDNLDALVTDVHMPGRLNGLGLGRRFRERHALSPILYVTGSPDALRDFPMRQDRDIALLKPCGLLTLVATLQAMLEGGLLGAD